MLLILKAQIKGAHTPDLFATPVHVAAHVAHGHVVRPYIAIRHKAPPEISHPKAVVVMAHPPEPAVPEKSPPITSDEPAPTIITTMPEVDIKAEAQRKAQAKKLREGALSHLAQAEEDLGRDRQSNTARRARMAAGSIKDAQQRALIAGTMNNIADVIEAGEGGHLAAIGTRAQVEALDLAARSSVYAWERDTKQPYHGDRDIIPELKHVPHARLPAGEWNVKERARLERMGLKTDQNLQAALREYLPLRGDRPREDPIKAAERALVGTKPGIDFFPTPPPLAQRMVQLANINPGEHVLEPSAGKGDIADAIRAAGGKVDAVELSDTLRKVIEAKGHKLVGTDFEAFDSHEQYDAIVMNPPWSGGADVRHVMRAFGMLKPGGRLVALMSMHPSFAQDKASVAFRAWMDGMGGEAEKIPASDFASQWMSGGIPSWLIRVDKPMTKSLFLKATIKGANTGDLFGQPVYVHPYVREGHTVQGHTEIRQVHHEAPVAPKPVIIARQNSDKTPTAESKPIPIVTTPVEPDHITQGRATLARYKEQIANREKRGLGGGLSTASDERSYKLWEARLAADPAKWQPGMGVSYQVSGGAKMQTNRGFRIASIDVAGKRAVLRQVADTGMTSSGGDHDRFEDSYVYLGELKRDKKHDAPIPVVSKQSGPKIPVDNYARGAHILVTETGSDGDTEMTKQAKYEVTRTENGYWVIRHIATGVIAESFDRKSSAMKRLNHSYNP